jgi:predicted ATPase
VFFVPLEPITRAELLPPTIAQSVGAPDPGGTTGQRLAEYLAERRILIVLDNFEQVDAGAPLIGDLLAQSAGLRVLATSRSPLRIYGEREYPVAPLGLPDPRHLPDLEQFTQFESVALFIERAVAVRPEFVVDSANAPAVAEICVRLDGLPLAIELAAARVRVLTPQAILDRLSDQLGLLSGGARDLPERQQTLRGAIAWSHDLLEEADRRAFARISVFAGGATLEQIEAVCFEPDERMEALDVVTSLVDKSLLREDAAGGAPRFRMLETIRQFAAERLEASEDAARLRTRHAAAVLAFAEEAAVDVLGTEGGTWLDRYELDRDNIRAAMGWALDAGEAETALRLLSACWRYWQIRGYLTEARSFAERALALPGAADFPAAREAALESAGGIAYWQGDMDTARAWYQETLELARARADDRAVANALYNLTFTYAWQPEAQAEARVVAEESLAVNRRLGDRLGIGRALWALGSSDYFAGDWPKALEAIEEALAIFQEVDDRFMVGWSYYMRGLVWMKSDPPKVRADLLEAYRIFRAADDVTGYALVFDAFAAAAHQAGDDVTAARLAGFAMATEHLAGSGLGAANRDTAGFHPEELMADAEFAANVARGGRMELAEAESLVLGQGVPP